ncbi:glycine zipper 2TM domain-containing protein [Lysobacter sp. FW306-1B-D06B]|uniref:glycine zipper 2TM domain-containing protein n=1 Tax=Lysobacter sp. FW306-1B-D06B TaxID=3140250 RepID=UPI0031404CD7
MRRSRTFVPALILGALGLALTSNAAAWQTKSSTAAKSSTSTKRPRCYDVEVEKPKEVKDEHKITGTVVGGLAGGLLGNQVGGGSGKKIATAAGAVGGAFAGRKIQDNQQKKTETVVERRCDP